MQGFHIIAALAVLLAPAVAAAGRDITTTKIRPFNDPVTDKHRVLIELFVMSRCPDARRAEARFDEVLRSVHSIADIRTVYIANQAQDGGIACMHGPDECAGNVQQLCAAKYGRQGVQAGTDPFSLGWSFIMCQNANFTDVGSPALAEACLQSARFPPAQAARVRACWSGPEGGRLLAASAGEALRRRVHTSCTVFVGGDYRCTQDGGQWRDCPGGSQVADFIASVCGSYRAEAGRWPEGACGAEPREEGEGEEGGGEEEGGR
ncbi:hypothetical protein Agub_g1035 [Astrephomene gubernaculifera]|uniref:Gamma-interferon-inducible lysosomal thiol reductase n=1 Tax=Astrephomene gubernaculifera TaxID=47775 RepID=A0AAD3DGR7_9CHLO|nr:hypothetical protein Agub_g1035 [Astrephomene gubernaculifera]